MAYRKNILLLIPSFAQPGGTQKLLCDLGKLLAEKHNVYECSFDAFREEHVFKNGNTVLSLGVREPRNVVEKLIGYPLKAFRLNRLKKKYRIDATISNLWPADFINVLSMGPGLLISHGVVNVVGNYQNRRMLEHHKFVGWIYRRFHMNVAINEDLRAELTKVFALHFLETCCIYPFVNFPADGEPEKIELPPRRRVVCFGRLNHIKNYIPLFKVMEGVKKRVPDVQLVIIGEGPHREEIVAAAKAGALSVSERGALDDADLVFLGFVEDPYRYLRASDVFALPSQSEGFGLVLVEAMSTGLPILASDCPTGGPHLIMEGKETYAIGRSEPEETPYGYLLPVPELGNVAAGALWEDAIVEMLENPRKRSEKGANSKSRALDFSKEKIQEEWFLLLNYL